MSEQIIELHEQGMSIGAICRELQMRKQVVAKIVRNHISENLRKGVFNDGDIPEDVLLDTPTLKNHEMGIIASDEDNDQKET